MYLKYRVYSLGNLGLHLSGSIKTRANEPAISAK